MKNPKPQPTSYKDFLQQIDKAKTTKTIQTFKPKQTPKTNTNSSCSSLHSQSTSLWDKRSPSQARIITEVSAEKKIKSHNQSVQGENKTTKSSKKDNFICYQKFISEATQILTKLLKCQSSELLTNRISYIQYLESLKSLKMIYDNYEPYPNDHVSQLWVECISGSNVGNFIITVCSILGLYEESQSQEDKYLRSKYDMLRYTRLELHKGRDRQNVYENQCTFTPMISDRSRKLAEKRSESGSKSKLSNRKPLKTLNSDRENEFKEKGSTFFNQRSKISFDEDCNQNICFNNFERVKSQAKIDYTGNKRSNILYERAKQKSSQKRSNKTSQDVQFQKNATELTFKPKILKLKSKVQAETPRCAVKGEKNTISRMIRGRVQREVRKIINDKGATYNQKQADKMRQQRYDFITAQTNFQSIPQTFQLPLEKEVSNYSQKESRYSPVQFPAKPHIITPDQDLVIDVYISQDRKQKLTVRKGQSLEQIATNFILEHDLPHEKKQQLVQLLQISISHALCPIDEAEEEEELASARSYNKREYDSFR